MSASSASSQVNRRSIARLWAVSALYQMEAGGTRLSVILEEYQTSRLDQPLVDPDLSEPLQLAPADRAYFVDLVEGTVKRQLIVDRRIARALPSTWPLPRLDSILRAVLRVGTYELVVRKDVPARVTINEYIEVAKSYFDEGGEIKLLNAVLDKLAHDAREFEFTKAMVEETRETVEAQTNPEDLPTKPSKDEAKDEN